MKNFILQNENAIYFECKFSCDNVIFLNLGDDKYFITDARYTTEAKEYAKNCEVIESSNLIETTKEILKKNKIKKKHHELLLKSIAKLCCFNGRVRRSECWGFFLINIAVYYGLQILSMVIEIAFFS
mgnify:CR=1 FL=1